jgi:hypothetical protein
MLENFKNLGEDPTKLEITKIAITDGMPFDFQGMAAFNVIKVDRDYGNGNKPTLWYTRYTGDPSVVENLESVQIQIRMFTEGTLIEPIKHHHVGSFWDDTLLWHVYLDRTENYNQERREVLEGLREAMEEMNERVGQVLDEVGGMPDTSSGIPNEILEKLWNGKDFDLPFESNVNEDGN